MANRKLNIRWNKKMYENDMSKSYVTPEYVILRFF